MDGGCLLGITQLVLSLDIKDILALASTNSDFYKQFASKEVNDFLANHYGFPYGLTLCELKQYEWMSDGDRLIIAAELGDYRIVNKLMGLCPDYIGEALLRAVNYSRLDIIKLLLENGGAPYVNEVLKFAVGYGNVDVVRLALPYHPTNLSTSLTTAKWLRQHQIVQLITDAMNE